MARGVCIRFSDTLALFTALLVTSIANALRQYLPPVTPRCTYFTGAGIYFWWQAGCARYMQEHCDLTSMPIMGASAGSISAALLLSNADFSAAADSAIRIGMEARVYERKTGLAGVWGNLVKQWLEEVIPDTVTPQTFERLHVAVTPTLKSPKLVTGFPRGKPDVVEALLASCHVPVFLDGRPTTTFRGEQVLDGSFWYFVTKDRVSGLPLPPDLPVQDIFWVDYGDDEDFMASISGNILELLTPLRILEMMDEGYAHMKREHYYGRLPMARFKKPLFVYTSDIVNRMSNALQWSVAAEEVSNFLSPIRPAALPPPPPPPLLSLETPVTASALNPLEVPAAGWNTTAVLDWTSMRSLVFRPPRLSFVETLSASLRRDLKSWTSLDDWERYFNKKSTYWV